MFSDSVALYIQIIWLDNVRVFGLVNSDNMSLYFQTMWLDTFKQCGLIFLDNGA